jgi:hypothetical protein
MAIASLLSKLQALSQKAMRQASFALHDRIDLGAREAWMTFFARPIFSRISDCSFDARVKRCRLWLGQEHEMNAIVCTSLKKPLHIHHPPSQGGLRPLAKSKDHAIELKWHSCPSSLALRRDDLLALTRAPTRCFTAPA